MKIVIIGGTGLIGSKTVKILRDAGHEVVRTSPGTGVNTITGEGLAEALIGARRRSTSSRDRLRGVVPAVAGSRLASAPPAGTNVSLTD